MNKPQWIIDVGLHKGQDAHYYLSRGFHVLGIDADPHLIDQAQRTFTKEIKEGRLRLLHAAITAHDSQEIDFYLSTNSLWSSVDAAVSVRGNHQFQKIRVGTRSLPSLMKEIGQPHYIKIDIEGSDALVLSTLQSAEELPSYLSVESECIRDGVEVSEDLVLETLLILRDLGFSQFKLVDQTTLRVVPLAGGFYTDPRMQIPPTGKGAAHWVMRRVKAAKEKLFDLHPPFQYHRKALKKQLGYWFEVGASGPFGEDLDGVWLNFEDARKCLLINREQYHGLPSSHAFGFWCDWHAKR